MCFNNANYTCIFLILNTNTRISHIKYFKTQWCTDFLHYRQCYIGKRDASISHAERQDGRHGGERQITWL